MDVKKIKEFLSSLVSKLKGSKEEVVASVPVKQSSTPKSPVNVESFRLDIFSPCDGELYDRKNIPDETFAEGLVGDGVGIKPSNSSVSAFMNGELKVVFKTKHAYIVKDPESGVSLMLHLGIDTVNIDSSKEAFSTTRKEGDVLKVNDALCSMNLEVIEQEGKSTVSALLVQDENMEGKKIIFHVQPGSMVKQGDLLMSVVSD